MVSGSGFGFGARGFAGFRFFFAFGFVGQMNTTRATIADMIKAGKPNSIAAMKPGGSPKVSRPSSPPNINMDIQTARLNAK